MNILINSVKLLELITFTLAPADSEEMLDVLQVAAYSIQAIK